MARGYNSVILVGAVTQTPELRHTSSGIAILDVQLAGIYKVVTDLTVHDITWYHRVTMLVKSAEILAEKLEEGSVVFVDARLRYETWEDDSGQRRSTLKLHGIRMDVLTEGVRGDEWAVNDARGQPRLVDSVNEVTAIGNLTKDAELRYTPNGHAVVRLSLAINEKYRDRSGQDQENTHYVDVQVWRDLAEACADLKKGAPVLASGRFVTDSWTDNDGNKRYQNRIEGTRVEFLARSTNGDNGSAWHASAPANGTAKAPPPRATPNLDIDEEFPPEEDLPF